MRCEIAANSKARVISVANCAATFRRVDMEQHIADTGHEFSSLWLLENNKHCMAIAFA